MKQATTRPRHIWDADADQKLREAVQKFGTNNWNIGNVSTYPPPLSLFLTVCVFRQWHITYHRTQLLPNAKHVISALLIPRSNVDLGLLMKTLDFEKALKRFRTHGLTLLGYSLDGLMSNAGSDGLRLVERGVERGCGLPRKMRGY